MCLALFQKRESLAVHNLQSSNLLVMNFHLNRRAQEEREKMKREAEEKIEGGSKEEEPKDDEEEQEPVHSTTDGTKTRDSKCEEEDVDDGGRRGHKENSVEIIFENSSQYVSESDGEEFVRIMISGLGDCFRKLDERGLMEKNIDRCHKAAEGLILQLGSPSVVEKVLDEFMAELRYVRRFSDQSLSEDGSEEAAGGGKEEGGEEEVDEDLSD